MICCFSCPKGIPLYSLWPLLTNSLSHLSITDLQYSWIHTVLLNLRLGRKLNHRWLGRWLALCRRTKKLAIFKFSRRLKLQDLWFTRNSRAAGGPHSLISDMWTRFNQWARWLAWPLRESPVRSLWLGSFRHFRLIIETVGLSLENLILKIRSRVNDRHSLWVSSYHQWLAIIHD